MAGDKYATIEVGGGDTATPRAMAARLNLLASLVDLDGRTLLDAGCGAGAYVRALRARGIVAVGVEHSAAKVAAHAATGADPAWVRQGDLAHLPHADATFDVVVLNEVLEHVPDDRAVLVELRRVLRADGVLVVFSPNRRYPFETHGVSWRGSGRRVVPTRTLGVPYLPVSIGQRLFDYPARNYWPGELRRLLTSVGFQIERSTYLWQSFENISGDSPAWIRRAAPLLRRIAAGAARVPGLRTLGVSQVLVAAPGLRASASRVSP